MKETDPMVALPPFPGGCAPALPADVTPKRSPDCPIGGHRDCRFERRVHPARDGRWEVTYER